MKIASTRGAASNPPAPFDITKLATWSAPKRVQTRNGERDICTASPTEEFWRAWRAAKEDLKAGGIQVKPDDFGGYTLLWWKVVGVAKAAPSKPTTRMWCAGGCVGELKLPEWLWAHQREDALHCWRNGSTIIANDMGTGKTQLALSVARASGCRTVVICPAGLKENWVRECAMLGVEAVEIHSAAKIPTGVPKPYVLLLDEAHWFQNMQSARVKAMLKLADQAEAVFPITGTPMRNSRPANLFPLLKAIKHPLAANRSFYENRYCGAHREVIKRRINGELREFAIWKTDGAANLEELRQKLSGWMVRRLKKDCMDLPTLTRVLRDVEPSEEACSNYDRAIKQAVENYKLRAERGEVLADAQALAELTAIRQAASMAKVESAIEIIEEVVEQGGQAVVFTEYVNSASAIARKWLCPVITGSMPKDCMMQVVDAFQAGKIKTLIATGRTGGTGLNLTAGNTVLLVDRPMTPGEADQWESRCHRGGTKWPVTSMWLRAFPIDRAIDKMLLQKQQTINTVLDGCKHSAGKIAAKTLTGLLEEEGQI